MFKPNNPQNQTLPPLSSLLWAHEIRRENIHILNELDTTKTNLQGTTSSLATLEQALTYLNETVKKLQDTTETEKSRTAVQLSEVRMAALSQIRDLVSWSEEAKDLNRVLWQKVEEGERKCEERVNRLFEERWEAWKESSSGYILEQMVRENARRSPSNRVIIRDASRQASRDQFLVANSVSTQQASPSIHKQPDHSPLQTGSQSTLGASGSNDSGQRQESSSRSYRQRGYTLRYLDEIGSVGESKVHYFKQDGRSILQYLAFVERERSQLRPNKREGAIVEAFVAGVDHLGTRIVIERALDEGGWTWDMLTKTVWSLAQAEYHQHPQRVLASEGGQKVKLRSKWRRQIPIVPADEEDR